MSQTDSRYDILFEPVQLGPVTAPNRFYAVPHATGHSHMEPNGSIALREMKARGGWGVVSMSITEISPDSDLASHPMQRLWHDSDLPMHQRTVERIKSHGALTAIELGHGGMRCRNFVSGKPVLGVGRFTSPDMMVSLVKAGRLDLIGAARPSIADPFLPNKVREGRIEELRECIGCNVCVSCDAYGVPIRCTQNPTIGEEWRRDWHPEFVPPAKSPQSVLIIGAGPAGMECALTLGRAGHRVTLVDANAELGGRLNRESALRGLFAYGRVAEHRQYQLQQLANVDIYLHSKLDADTAVEFGADHIVVATGARWRRDGLGGTRPWPLDIADEVTVLTPDDLMDGVELAGDALIYDDDHYYLGGVLAAQLQEQGCRVTLATPLPTISAWTAYTLEQPQILAQLTAAGVKLQPNRKLARLAAGSARFDCALTGAELGEQPFDHVVLITARLPRNALHEELVERLGEERVSAIGDCLVPGMIQAAVYSGHKAARQLNGDPLAAGSFRREQPILCDPSAESMLEQAS